VRSPHRIPTHLAHSRPFRDGEPPFYSIARSWIFRNTMLVLLSYSIPLFLLNSRVDPSSSLQLAAPVRQVSFHQIPVLHPLFPFFTLLLARGYRWQPRASPLRPQQRDSSVHDTGRVLPSPPEDPHLLTPSHCHGLQQHTR